MVALHVALALLLAWLLGRYGARALSALGRLTPTERDDRFFRALGFLWWGVVALLALSYLAHALAWPLEPLATWGKALAQWLGSRGLAALAVVGLTFLGYRLIPLLLARLPEPEGELTREVVRRKTLRAVADSVLKVAILTLGGLFLLSNLGFNVTALLAGAGVVGLAISFAAQNLIRDFINGFFILLEDQ